MFVVRVAYVHTCKCIWHITLYHSLTVWKCHINLKCLSTKVRLTRSKAAFIISDCHFGCGVVWCLLYFAMLVVVGCFFFLLLLLLLCCTHCPAWYTLLNYNIHNVYDAHLIYARWISVIAPDQSLLPFSDARWASISSCRPGVEKLRRFNGQPSTDYPQIKYLQIYICEWCGRKFIAAARSRAYKLESGWNTSREEELLGVLRMKENSSQLNDSFGWSKGATMTTCLHSKTAFLLKPSNEQANRNEISSRRATARE